MGEGLLKSITGAFAALITPNACASCRSSMKKADAGRLCDACTRGLGRPAAPLCTVCGVPMDDLALPAADGSCGDCRGGRSFASAHAYGLFDGTLRDLIRRLKYQGDKSLAEPLGQLVLQVAQESLLLQDYDAIVPVPLHRDRFTERGFNQTFLLARPLAREARLPVVPALERLVNATAQVGLKGESRRSNVQGAFTVHPRKVSEITRRNILLVDDVITTGATADACAEALTRAGAKSVAVVAVARTP